MAKVMNKNKLQTNDCKTDNIMRIK